jgi:hypothetical protein
MAALRPTPCEGHETGRRSESFTALSWGDVNLEGRTITWRRELDKKGNLWVTAMSEALEDMFRARLRRLVSPPRPTDAIWPVTPPRLVRPKLRGRGLMAERLVEYAKREAEWQARVEAAREARRGTPITPHFRVASA